MKYKIQDYLADKNISKRQLFDSAAEDKVTLLVHLRGISGVVDYESYLRKKMREAELAYKKTISKETICTLNCEITLIDAILALSNCQCSKLVADPRASTLFLSARLKLIEGRFGFECVFFRDRQPEVFKFLEVEIKASPEIELENTSFYPNVFSSEELKGKKHEKYALKLFTTVDNDHYYCYAVPITDLFVEETAKNET